MRKIKISQHTIQDSLYSGSCVSPPPSPATSPQCSMLQHTAELYFYFSLVLSFSFSFSLVQSFSLPGKLCLAWNISINTSSSAKILFLNRGIVFLLTLKRQFAKLLSRLTKIVYRGIFQTMRLYLNIRQDVMVNCPIYHQVCCLFFFF